MATGTRRIPHPLAFAIVGVAVGAVLAALAVMSWREDRAIEDRGRETTARVVQVRERAWPKDHRVRVEFVAAEGRTVRAWIGADRDGTPRVGQEVPVRYDPRDPAGNMSDARHTGRNLLPLFAVAAVFLLGAPAVAWFLIRPARRALAVHNGQ